MTDQIAGICPVCDAKIMRPWRYSAQAFGRQTLIHFACLDTWWRVIGAWHTELADRPILEQEQPAPRRCSCGNPAMGAGNVCAECWRDAVALGCKEQA